MDASTSRSASTPARERRIESRLRLKRSLLWALVGSLAAGGLLATGVLVFGQFNELTLRILITLMSFAAHAGVAMVCLATIERGLWPWLNRTCLVLLAADFLAFAIAWWSTYDWAAWGHATMGTLILMGTYLAAIPPAALWQRGRRRTFAATVLILCGVTLAWSVLAIWADYAYGGLYMTLGRPAAIAGTAACAGSWVCLLHFAPAQQRAGVVRLIVFGGIVALAIVISFCIWIDDMPEPAARAFGVAGVVSICGSLSLPILARLRKVQQTVHIETSRKTVELRCPRCGGLHIVGIGDSHCPDCGLRIRIDIEEPRCKKCGYLLWQLTQRRCPECGEPF